MDKSALYNNIDFWAITIGFIGTLVPLIYTKLKNKKMRNIILRCERNAKNNIETLKQTMKYEKIINKTNNKMQSIIFIMIALSYILQLISIIWK